MFFHCCCSHKTSQQDPSGGDALTLPEVGVMGGGLKKATHDSEIILWKSVVIMTFFAFFNSYLNLGAGWFSCFQPLGSFEFSFTVFN